MVQLFVSKCQIRTLTSLHLSHLFTSAVLIIHVFTCRRAASQPHLMGDTNTLQVSADYDVSMEEVCLGTYDPLVFPRQGPFRN